MMFGLFLVVFSLLANCNSLDLLPLDGKSNRGEKSPETEYKAGQPGANWTPEEIDFTRQRILQAITPIWPEKIGKKSIIYIILKSYFLLVFLFTSQVKSKFFEAKNDI